MKKNVILVLIATIALNTLPYQVATADDQLVNVATQIESSEVVTQADPSLPEAEATTDNTTQSEASTDRIETLSEETSLPTPQPGDLEKGYADSFRTLMHQIYPNLDSHFVDQLATYFEAYIRNPINHFDGDSAMKYSMRFFPALRKPAEKMGWSISADFGASNFETGKLVYKVNTEGKKNLYEVDADTRALVFADLSTACAFIGLTATPAADGKSIQFTSDDATFTTNLTFVSEYGEITSSFNTLLSQVLPKLKDSDRVALVNYYETFLQQKLPGDKTLFFKSIREDIGKVMGFVLRLDMDAMMAGKTVYIVDKEGVSYFKDLTAENKALLKTNLPKTASMINLTATEIENGVQLDNPALHFSHQIIFATETTNNNNNNNDNNSGTNGDNSGTSGGHSGGDSSGGGGGGGGSDQASDDESLVTGSVDMLDKLLGVYFKNLDASKISDFKRYAETYSRKNGIGPIMTAFTYLRYACESTGYTVSFPNGLTSAPTLSGTGETYYKALSDDQKAQFSKNITSAGQAMGLTVSFSDTSVRFSNAATGFNTVVSFKQPSTDAGNGLMISSEERAIENKKITALLTKETKAKVLKKYKSALKQYFPLMTDGDISKIMEKVKVDLENDPIDVLAMFNMLGKANADITEKVTVDLSMTKGNQPTNLFKDLTEEQQKQSIDNITLSLLEMGMEGSIDKDTLTITTKDGWRVSQPLDNMMIAIASDEQETVKQVPASDVLAAYKALSNEDKQKYDDAVKAAFAKINADVLIHNGAMTIKDDKQLNINTRIEEEEKALKLLKRSKAYGDLSTGDKEKYAQSLIDAFAHLGAKATIHNGILEVRNDEGLYLTTKLNNPIVTVIEKSKKVEAETKPVLEEDSQKPETDQLSMVFDSKGISFTNPEQALAVNTLEEGFDVNKITETLHNANKMLRVTISSTYAGKDLSFVISSPEIKLTNETIKFENVIAYANVLEATPSPSPSPSDTRAKASSAYVYKNKSVANFFESLLVKYFPLLSQADRKELKIYVDQYEATKKGSSLAMAYSTMRMACESMGFTVVTDLSKMMQGEVKIDVGNDGEPHYRKLTPEQKKDFEYYVKKAAAYEGLEAIFTPDNLTLKNAALHFELVIKFSLA